LDFFKVSFGSHYRFIEIRVDNNTRIVLHARFLAPNQWNWSSCLDVWWDLHWVVIQCYNVLWHHKVCSIAFPVKTSHDESFAWTSAIFSGNKSKIELIMFKLECFNEHISINAWSSECRVLRMWECWHQVIVEYKLCLKVVTVRILLVQSL
jgi:hypothetical protein